MNTDVYNELLKKNTPKVNKFKNAFISFMVGGTVGVIGEILVLLYSMIFNISLTDAGPIMLITIIFFSSLFTSLGFFDDMVSFCKCGLIIPITGFAHSVTSCALEYRKEGLIYGIGSNMLKLAGSVIIYGIVSSFFFGLIRYLLGI